MKLSLEDPLSEVTNEQFIALLKNMYAHSEKARIYSMVQSADRLFPEEYQSIYGSSLKFEPEDLKEVYKKYFSTRQTFTEQIIQTDFNVKMPDDFLLADDATSMAHSLESRVPYLDSELVDLAFTLPLEVKIRNGYGKYILKKTLEPHLHISTLKKKKQGFGPNTYNSYLNEVKECAEQKLLDRELVKNHVVKEEYIKKILTSKPNPELTRKYILIWNLLGLEVWWDIYINRCQTTQAPNYRM